ncbi:MAG TPA: hypothetical protein VF192_05010 [Longimicrobiales bacterium]
MTDPTGPITPPARLTLFGYTPVPAHVRAIHRPRSLRLSRALLSLFGCWALAPLVALVPPHFPWALTAFGAGIYFARTNWRGTYEIQSLEARCPGCGNALTVKPGTRIGAQHQLTCYNCHHEPLLELPEPQEGA